MQEKVPDMALEVVRDLADTIIGNNPFEGDDTDTTDSNPSAETVIRAPGSTFRSSLSYVLPADDSLFSRDVDHWIQGDSATDTGVQGSRFSTAQRSTLATSSSLDATRVWYLAAMILPFMGINNTLLWRCTPSTVLSTAELLLTQVAYLCGQARSHLRRLAHEQAAQDLFATAMDIILVIYAMGFLLLSLYQASFVGNW